ncbi:MAG: hypothetical protein HC939_24710 [Pleurocapsa sp. SU_5_0]|nr:hypothetical protein [Pleurocapsa sp. SU_5_0]
MTNHYVYGCLTYILLLFSVQLYNSLLIDCEALDRSIESVDTDFYSQVKDLLNPSTEDVFEPTFESMTLRELRTHIKENKLHQVAIAFLFMCLFIAKFSQNDF